MAPAAPVLGGTARFSARLYRQGGWLLGSPSTVPLTQEITDPRTAFEDVRLRELELGLDVSFSGAGAPAITNPWVRLYDAALHGPTIPFTGAANAFGFGVIGALLRTFSSNTVPATGSAGALVDALSAIGIMQRDASSVLGLSQDAWTALENDAAGFLASRVPAALDLPGGWLGFAGSAGSWTWNPGGTLVICLERDGTRGPWSVRLRSGAEAEAPGLLFEADARFALPSFAADVNLTLGIGGLSATWHSAAGAESLVVNAAPWAEQVQLLPALGAAALTASLSALWPKMLFSGALSLGLHAVAPGLRLAAVERFFKDTSGELLKAFTDVTGGLSVARARALLNALSTAAGLSPDDGITLPGGLRLMVEEEPPQAGASLPVPSAHRRRTRGARRRAPRHDAACVTACRDHAVARHRRRLGTAGPALRNRHARRHAFGDPEHRSRHRTFADFQRAGCLARRGRRLAASGAGPGSRDGRATAGVAAENS